ncbi:LytR/AlgR family response regulator transcription factor [Jiulongibacter sediminis]|uniref:HTH LytTR-type domain-containing protein n=1 Tax=Jiulongibacter sediminis TaxID=1605367 RepID=A0A0P7BUW6_9BACT|nr:LytTR family DNA-binding domain-containing protein [Jiulongibacter sediminis]KPM48648.1 hypothetical protein AFM12_08575 [Jiulongibacter sediminis]TBX25185.1 hypothetical protein TK44_08580 [Jiulongibacter sediminis]
MRFKKLIQQPYPFEDGERSAVELIFRSFLVGVFITAFLLIFQPFGSSNWKNETENWYWYVMGFGLITFACLLFMRFVVIRLFPGYFNEKDWTVGREILLNICFLIFIAFSNFVYEASLFVSSWSPIHFLWSLMTVVAIGIFPIIFDVLAKYHRALKKFMPEKQIVISPEVKSDKIELTAENGIDKIEFESNELLFIESADNYSKVVLKTSEPELLRSSLSRLESQILSKNIKRCHRSFIVNLDKVERVTGNAQGYKLHLEGSETLVPVARKYSELVHELREVSQ